MIIDETEREDFGNILSERGFDPTDFELSEKEDPMTGGGVQPITGQVIVTRKSTGAEKTYAAGDRSRWVAEFSDDLERGYFD